MVTDSEEEAIDGQVYALFIGLAEALDEMYAFDAIFTVEAHGIVLVEDGDLLVGCDALTHNVRGAEVVLAHDHIDVRGEARQVECLFAGRVTATDDSDLLIAVEEAVTGSTGRDAHTSVLLFVGQAEVLSGSTRSDDDRIGFDLDTFLEGDDVGSLREVSLRRQTRADLRTEAQSLIAEVLGERWAGDPLGITREVLYIRGLRELSSRLDAFVEEWGEVGT